MMRFPVTVHDAATGAPIQDEDLQKLLTPQQARRMGPSLRP